MKQSNLKNKVIKTKLPTDIRNNKKQRNYVVDLYKKQSLNTLVDMAVTTVLKR